MLVGFCRKKQNFVADHKMRAFYLIQMLSDAKLAIIAYRITLARFNLSNHHNYYTDNDYQKIKSAVLVESEIENRRTFEKGEIVIHMGYFTSYDGVYRHAIIMCEGSLFMTQEPGHDLGVIRHLEKV